MMTLKEIANAFDMTVDDFAKCVGYTRQSLYDKTSVRKQARAKAAISLLRFLNSSMLQEDMAKASQRCATRRRAIEAFGRLFLESGDGNG